MDLNEVLIFIRVAQAGSFTQAARQLDMPNSTVSAKISSLEKRLGLTLIQRTTRKLNLTPAGREYFRRCLAGVAEIQAAELEISSLQTEPTGLLRVTAPAELGAILLPALAAKFTERFPKAQVELLLTDRRVDLMAEGVDLAIRAGRLSDSTLIAKKIGETQFALFASPKYLKLHGLPKHPRDLNGLKCLHFTSLGERSWSLIRTNGERTKVAVHGQLLANDLNVIQQMTLADQGVALLPNFLAHTEVARGRLVSVLPDWHSTTTPVHFVYPAQKYVTAKLKQFIAMADKELSRALGSN